jgi:hypothetical protein
MEGEGFSMDHEVFLRGAVAPVLMAVMVYEDGFANRGTETFKDIQEVRLDDEDTPMEGLEAMRGEDLLWLEVFPHPIVTVQSVLRY